MPAVSVVPLPTVIYTRDVTWPDWGVRIPDAGAFVTSGAFSNGQSAASFWNVVSGAGGSAMQTKADGRFGGWVASTGAGATAMHTSNWKAYVPLLRSTVYPSLYQQPVAQRLFRYQFTMWEDSGSLTFACGGGGFAPEAGAEAGTPATGGNRFFGVMGDGAGGWAWKSRSGGGAGFSEIVPLNIGLATVAHTFDLVIVFADSFHDAFVNLYVDGTIKLGRSWGAGTVLPDYSGVALASHFTPLMVAGDTAIASRISFGNARLMMGNFLPDGTAI